MNSAFDNSQFNTRSGYLNTIYKFTPIFENVTGITSTFGQYQRNNGIVFFFISISGTVAWAANSRVNLPVSPFKTSNGSFIYANGNFSLIDQVAKTVVFNPVMSTTDGKLYLPQSGSNSNTLMLSGFYYTGA